MHRITLGTCGSRPSEGRGWEARARLDCVPFPRRGGGGVGAPPFGVFIDRVALFVCVADISAKICPLRPSIRLAVIRAIIIRGGGGGLRQIEIKHQQSPTKFAALQHAVACCGMLQAIGGDVGHVSRIALAPRTPAPLPKAPPTNYKDATQCKYCRFTISGQFRFSSVLLTYGITKWRNLSLFICRRSGIKKCGPSDAFSKCPFNMTYRVLQIKTTAMEDNNTIAKFP